MQHLSVSALHSVASLPSMSLDSGGEEVYFVFLPYWILPSSVAFYFDSFRMSLPPDDQRASVLDKCCIQLLINQLAITAVTELWG